jgi:hypothetical protein
VAAFLYVSSSSYLSYAVNIFLRPLYVVTPFFQVYPAMTAAYVSSATVLQPPCASESSQSPSWLYIAIGTIREVR